MNVSTEELKTLTNTGAARALDVRSAAEYAIDHIPGSINLPMEQLEARMGDLPDGPLVLVCEGGKRAQIVADWLHEHRDVTVLDGGMRSWRKDGLPTLACAPCRWSLERQVRFGAGAMVLLSALLAVLVNPRWVYLAMFVGAGLTFAGLSNICGMAMLLAKMPWNSQNRTPVGAQTLPSTKCCT